MQGVVDFREVVAMTDRRNQRQVISAAGKLSRFAGLLGSRGTPRRPPLGAWLVASTILSSWALWLNAAGADEPPAPVPGAPTPSGAPSPSRPATTAPATTAAATPTSQSADDSAQDYEFQSGIRCPYCVPTPEYPQGRFGLHWHDRWRRVGWAEYVSTPLLFGTSLLFSTSVLPAPKSANWTGPILFDSAARSSLEFKSRTARKNADTVSTVLMYTSLAQNLLVDNLVATMIVRNNPDVAWQMGVINAQSYGLTLAVSGVVKHFVARERPYGDQCGSPTSEFSCTTKERYRSFFSGHASLTATSTGLVCAHHTHLNLYGDDLADGTACVSSALIAVSTSVLRIASENHWASDVIVGDLVGFASGYFLPTLVYYKKLRVLPAQDHPTYQPHIAILPMFGPDSVQIGAGGDF